MFPSACFDHDDILQEGLFYNLKVKLTNFIDCKQYYNDYTGCVSESGDFATLRRMLLSPFCCQL